MAISIFKYSTAYKTKTEGKEIAEQCSYVQRDYVFKIVVMLNDQSTTMQTNLNSYSQVYISTYCMY